MRHPRVSPLFGACAAFEFRYQLRSPMFYVTAAIFLAASFLLVAVPQMSRGFAGASHVNSPHAIRMIIGMMSWLGTFIPIVFLSSVVMRDHKLGTEGLFFTRPVTEFDYLAGRFVGAFAVCCTLLLVVPVAILAGTLAPWLDPETLGPLRPLDYIYNFLIFGAANLLIPGTLL
ncbi:MAG TPA: hypothetical protein VKB34_22210, partial [Povalibacter sp.]|nr:hypothetical protein [Povalibacter sp.]